MNDEFQIGGDDTQEFYGVSEKLENADRQIRIKRLREEARKLGADNVKLGEDDDLDPEDAEEFWEQVVDFEKAPWTTLRAELDSLGIELPDPAGLPDEEVAEHLEIIIPALASMRVFLERTNHLGDAELYHKLWSDVLREETKLLPNDPVSAYHLDMLGGGSDEDNQIYLTYYADEAERMNWTEQFPDEILPDHVDPPYDRDARLPRPESEFD